MRVLAVDPGLTRLGLGVVDGGMGRNLQLVDVGLLQTARDLPTEQRLLQVEAEFTQWLTHYAPDVVAIERVFSQHNVRTAMGTAQAAGIIMVSAARIGIPVALHTPSEVKAAVSGNGRADKKQVAQMVVRILGLASAPKPVDTTDALALAICHLWRGSVQVRLTESISYAKSLSGTSSLLSPVGHTRTTDKIGE